MNRVLVFGAACLDYIAEVNHFPSPDEKLRTNSLTICGGGNAGNTATCLSRLGVPVRLIAKMGYDLNGDKILQSFHDEKNIETDFIIRSSSISSSPMSYIIVDRMTQTRTCLFSADHEQILIDEIRMEWFEQVEWIHFDSRSTEAAVQLAKVAPSKHLRFSLDLERERPFLDQLIPRMNYIITTDRYCRNVCHDANPSDTAMKLLQNFPQTCRFVIITCGKEGSMLVERCEKDFSSDKATILHRNGETFLLWTCEAWPIASTEILDTTGSGDAFIGAVIYCLLANESCPRDRLLRFASYVAMCKLKGIGARSTLPFLSNIDLKLFFE